MLFRHVEINSSDESSLVNIFFSANCFLVNKNDVEIFDLFFRVDDDAATSGDAVRWLNGAFDIEGERRIVYVYIISCIRRRYHDMFFLSFIH